MQASDSIAAPDVDRALQDVLARTGESPSLLTEFIEWLTSRVGFDADVARNLFWVLGVLLVAAFVYFAMRMVRANLTGGARRFGGEEGARRGPSIAERVALLRAEAAEARARGDLKLALRKQFFALVLGLGGRGDLQFRDAWTNREVLARGRPSPEVDRLLFPLVTELEAKEFGRAPVSTADLDRLEALCANYLGDAR